MEIIINHIIVQEKKVYLWSEIDVRAVKDTTLGQIEGSVTIEVDLARDKPEDVFSQIDHAVQYAISRLNEQLALLEKNMQVVEEVAKKYNAKLVVEVRERKSDP